MVPSSGAVRRARHARRQPVRALSFWLHENARKLFMTACMVLFPIVRWFGIPSPFAAAALLACPDKPSLLLLAGLGLSLAFRGLWGMEADVWQYAACTALWLYMRRRRPRAGMETAALGGLSMMPRLLLAAMGRRPLETLLSFAAVPLGMLFAVLLRRGADAAVSAKASLDAFGRLCMLLWALLAIGALGYFRLGALCVGQAAAVMGALVYARLNGPVEGLAGGLACGLALVLSGHDAQLTLALAITGFLGGLPALGRFRWATLPAVALADLLSWFAAPLAAVPLGMWTALTGAAAYCLLPQRTLEKLKPSLHGVQVRDRSMENAFVSQRIEHMQTAIEKLARALPAWEDEPAADGAAATLCARRQAALRKARYERDLTLTHLAALSGNLRALGEVAAGETFADLRAAHVMTLALAELNVPARLSYARRVDGHLHAALETEGMLGPAKALEPLLAYLAREEALALAVTRTGKGRVELEEIPLYRATVGITSVCAEGGEACGDACSVQRCEDGRLRMLLLDGMGHGTLAHRQSEKTLELLSLLLEAGYTRHQAITAVNGIMLGVLTEERFSTVDVAEIDLWTGEVYSEKLGACASWVVRGNHFRKVEGSSLPLGIVQEAASTAAQYRLHSGDILVMMSDGVSDVFENDQEIKKTLADSVFMEPQRMADAIVRNALIAGGGAPKDDMSVMVMLLMDRHRGKETVL